MKKALILIFALGLCCCACTKNCTCSVGNNNTSSQNVQELEVAYNENCADYSNSNMECR